MFVMQTSVRPAVRLPFKRRDRLTVRPSQPIEVEGIGKSPKLPISALGREMARRPEGSVPGQNLASKREQAS